VAIAEEQEWFLGFLWRRPVVRAPLIVILSEVASGGVVINALEETESFRTQVLLELKRKRELLLVVVRTPAVLGTINCIHGITESRRCCRMRTGLGPVAAA